MVCFLAAVSKLLGSPGGKVGECPEVCSALVSLEHCLVLQGTIPCGSARVRLLWVPCALVESGQECLLTLAKQRFRLSNKRYGYTTQRKVLTWNRFEVSKNILEEYIRFDLLLNIPNVHLT